MKAAISTDSGMVSAHFGRCPVFTLLEIEDGKITKQEEIQNPGHEPGFLPNFLKEKGVNYIIAGGMGRRAEMLFAENNIQPIMGISGPITAVIEALCQGKLQGGESLCRPGAGKGYGIEKAECDHEEN